MRISLLLVLAALLSGCVGGWPESAVKLREEARKYPTRLSNTFEVARPLADVAGAMRTQSAACLNVRFELGHYNPIGTKVSDGFITYKPTFINHAKWAELHVQSKHEVKGQRVMGKLPPDGGYEVVMDATAVSASRTKIEIFRAFPNDRTVAAMENAFTHWAKGDNLGCPVL